MAKQTPVKTPTVDAQAPQDAASVVSRETGRMPSCTSCGLRDAAPNGKDYWCLECRAEYQRKYRSADAIRARAEGYATGVADLRVALREWFEGQRSGMFSGYEISEIIRQQNSPREATRE